MLRLLKKFDTAKQLVPRPDCTPAKQPTRLGAIYFGSTSPAMDEAEEILAEQRHPSGPAAGARLSVPQRRQDFHR